MKNIIIDSSNFNQRLDKFILKYLNKAPKSFVFKMLRKKRIKLNNKKALGNEILKIDDVLTFYISDDTLDSFKEEKSLKLSSFKDLDIIFEDSNILIVNKEPSLLSHAQSSGDKDTIVDRVLFYLHNKGEYDISKNSSFTPSICNRLDRNTSGIIICGKNLSSMQTLNSMMSNKKVKKYYLTLVKGKLEGEGILKNYYIKNTSINKGTIVSKSEEDSKKIITKYTSKQIFNNCTLLEIELVTGKSHQIRLHLNSIGHPIIGDRKYGDFKTNQFFSNKFGITNQLLHAYKIIFDDEDYYLYEKEFIAPLPNDFYKIITTLQRG